MKESSFTCWERQEDRFSHSISGGSFSPVNLIPAFCPGNLIEKTFPQRGKVGLEQRRQTEASDLENKAGSPELGGGGESFKPVPQKEKGIQHIAAGNSR